MRQVSVQLPHPRHKLTELFRHRRTQRVKESKSTDTCCIPVARDSSVLSKVSPGVLIPSLFDHHHHQLTDKLGLRDSHIQYLYDLTFLYSAPGSLDYRAPSLDEQLSSDDLARAGFRYRIHVSRIPLNTLPRDTDGLKGWFEKAWGEKDEWLEKMTREGQDEKGDL